MKTKEELNELADAIDSAEDSVGAAIRGAADDIRKGKLEWALVALDEAQDELTRIMALVEELEDES